MSALFSAFTYEIPPFPFPFVSHSYAEGSFSLTSRCQSFFLLCFSGSSLACSDSSLLTFFHTSGFLAQHADPVFPKVSPFRAMPDPALCWNARESYLPSFQRLFFGPVLLRITAFFFLWFS